MQLEMEEKQMSKKPYENKKGVNIRVTEDKRGITHIDIYDRDPSEKEKETIHIKHNPETGKGTIVEKDTSGTKTITDTSCYLTSACMSHYLTNFDDNCYELTVLRWFRDNFVSKEDIKHYYKTAPMIVEAIEQEEYKDIIYNYIYDNVVDACVEAIENGDYDFAYNRYKESILSLEQTYLKINLEHKLVRALKNQTI